MDKDETELDGKPFPNAENPAAAHDVENDAGKPNRAPNGSVAEFFLSSPLAGIEIDLERQRGDGREIEL